MLPVFLALLTTTTVGHLIVVQDHDASKFRTLVKRNALNLAADDRHISLWKPVDGSRAGLDISSSRSKSVRSIEVNEALKSPAIPPIELVIRANPPDAAVHPQLQQQQELNRIAKRFGYSRPVDIIEKHQEDLVKRGVSTSFSKRAASLTVVASQPGKTLGQLAIDQDGKDVTYFSTIRLGSNLKPFKMVMDTGSSDLWVPAADCKDKACLNHSTFGPEDSDTYRASKTDWKIAYGSGAAMGNLVQDTMQFAGLALGPVTFGTASRLTNSFANFPADGIMGLGGSNSSTQKIPTIMDNLMTAGLLERKLFGVNLNRAADESRDGLISFGSIDVSKFAGPLVSVPNVAKSGLWEAKLDGISVGAMKITIPAVATGIIDTGTTLLIAPSPVATGIHAAIPDAQTDTQGTFAVPCDTALHISLVFGGQAFPIGPKDYIGHTIEGVNSVRPLCLSKISGQTIKGPNTLLVGDVFLKNVYSVYDFDKNEIGFGAKPL